MAADSKRRGLSVFGNRASDWEGLRLVAMLAFAPVMVIRLDEMELQTVAESVPVAGS